MPEKPERLELTVDPVKFLADVEKIWRARDGQAAAAGYTEDAIVYYGENQTHSGKDLKDWPARWFAYAKDLDIRKTYRAHSGNCIVGTWRSTYTNPESGQKMVESGAEIFYLRGDKVCEHHMWQHSWTDGETRSNRGFAV